MPSGTTLKSSGFGVIVRSVAVPRRLITSGLLKNALSATVSVPLMIPALVGEKYTSTVQVEPFERLPAQSSFSLKLALGVMLLIVSGPAETSVSVTGPLVVPVSCVSKIKLDGEPLSSASAPTCRTRSLFVSEM